MGEPSRARLGSFPPLDRVNRRQQSASSAMLLPVSLSLRSRLGLPFRVFALALLHASKITVGYRRHPPFHTLSHCSNLAAEDEKREFS
jgi:hypothetical protein